MYLQMSYETFLHTLTIINIAMVTEITIGTLESLQAEVTYKYGSLICIIINSQFLLASSFGLKYLKETHSNFFPEFL
jgi:hypothetical protein